LHVKLSTITNKNEKHKQKNYHQLNKNKTKVGRTQHNNKIMQRKGKLTIDSSILSLANYAWSASSDSGSRQSSSKVSGEYGPGLGYGPEAHVTRELGRTPVGDDRRYGRRTNDGDGFEYGGHGGVWNWLQVRLIWILLCVDEMGLINVCCIV
jgi:hypothetical protein